MGSKRMSIRQSSPWHSVLLALAVVLSPACAAGPDPDLQAQVFAAERAFARTMAERDLDGFASHLSDEATFVEGQTLRGKEEVIAGWARFFEGDAPPFSWEPDQVEVLPSGTLALSTGLVRDPQGKAIGRFNSIWRQEAPGVWKVVFDKGRPLEPNDG